MRHRRALLLYPLLLVCVACCGSERAGAPVEEPEPTTSSDPTTSAEPDALPQQPSEPPSRSTAERQLPLVIQARRPDAFVEAGAPAGSERFFNVTVEVESGELVMIGCVASVAGACFATWRFVFNDEQEAEFDRRWAEVAGRPRCEPDAVFPGDRELTASWADHSETAPWPSDAAQMETRNQGACRALPRLVWWLVQISPASSR